ncbi:hypothetical protein N9L68_06025 [bacterium]|nr:hypothetical protein [bacterium]
MSHHGEPEEEEEEEEAEVVVIEELERQGGDEPCVVRMLGLPAPKHIEAHSATHVPHEKRWELCMAARGRNKPHRARASREDEGTSDEVDASHVSLSEDLPHCCPVPRIRMGYFYVSSRRIGPRAGARGMSTKELQNTLAEMGKSTQCQPNVLVKRYVRYVFPEYHGALTSSDGVWPHASEHPLLFMVDESAGSKYMRAVSRK